MVEGDELTAVTRATIACPTLAAAVRFEGRVEVLNLRMICPWDEAAVLRSVAETSRCPFVHEGAGPAAFGAETPATVGDEAFIGLDAPLRRRTTPEDPIPCAVQLMASVLPNEARMVEERETLLQF